MTTKSLRTILRTTLLTGTLAAGALSMQAESFDMKVHVPFAFAAGGKMFPAGDYLMAKSGAGILRVQGETGASALLLVSTEHLGEAAGPSARFVATGEGFALSGIQSESSLTRVMALPKR